MPCATPRTRGRGPLKNFGLFTVWGVYIVPRIGLAQTCKRTETLQRPPTRRSSNRRSTTGITRRPCTAVRRGQQRVPAGVGFASRTPCRVGGGAKHGPPSVTLLLLHGRRGTTRVVRMPRFVRARLCVHAACVHACRCTTPCFATVYVLNCLKMKGEAFARGVPVVWEQV